MSMTKNQLVDLIKETVKDTLASETFERNNRPTNASNKELAQIIARHVSGIAQVEGVKGRKGARVLRALCAAKNDPNNAIKWLEKNFPDDDWTKALTISGEDGTDFIMPAEISADLIELLRNTTAVRKLNPVVLQVNASSIQMPKLVSGSVASYIGSNDNIRLSKPTFGLLRMDFKKVACIVPVSNDLIRYSNPSADDVVQRDLVLGLSQREDLAFIRDDGTENTPKGLYYWCPSGNKFNSAGNTLANMTADLGGALLKLMEGNSRLINPGWMMAPRSFIALATVRDSNGNFAFRDELLRGSLWGFPYAVSNNIPITLGGDGNDSEIYLADFADVIIAENMQMRVDASNTAAYDNGGTTAAAFSLDQTVLRIIAEHDLGVRHPESIAVIEAVNWTPSA